MSAQPSVSTEDKVEIHELLARYAWSFGTGDIEGFVACFAEDAVLCEDVFEKADRWVGKAQIREMAEHFFAIPHFPGRQHHPNNILIEGTAEECRVRAFCFVIDATSNNQPCSIPFAGHYDDRVIKVAGRWVFKERLVRHWSGPILANFPGQEGIKIPRNRPTG